MYNSIVKKCSWFNTNSGLLVLRIGLGIIFIFAGFTKLSDLNMTVSMFATMGFSAFWAYVVTFTELIAGLAVLLGVYTRIAALLLGVIMVVVLTLVYKDITLIMTPITLLFSSLALVFAGGGSYSLMKKLCGCGTCSGCADCTVTETK